MDFFVDGRLAAENITPPNEKTKASINERYNKGKIKSIWFGLNRTTGSTEVKYKDGLPQISANIITNTDYSGKGTLTADVKVDDIVLKTVETKPVSLIYSADGTKINGVSIKNERAAETDEKMLVAVYENVNGAEVLKGISMCADVEYGKNSLSLETPLSVSSGDTVKVFFWDMIKLLPKAFLETVK